MKLNVKDLSINWWKGGTMASVTVSICLNVGMQVRCHKDECFLLTSVCLICLLLRVLQSFLIFFFFFFLEKLMVGKGVSFSKNSASSKMRNECTTLFKPPGGSTIKAHQTVIRTTASLTRILTLHRKEKQKKKQNVWKWSWSVAPFLCLDPFNLLFNYCWPQEIASRKKLSLGNKKIGLFWRGQMCSTFCSQ